jgi:predicted DNA-binding transcriptional regulator AlpA
LPSRAKVLELGDSEHRQTSLNGNIMAPKTKRAPVAVESTNKPRRKPATDIHANRYLSESAWARFAGVSRTTVWKMRRDGLLRYVQISPRLVRIPTSEIERLGKLPVEKLTNVGKKKIQHLVKEDEEDEGEAA